MSKTPRKKSASQSPGSKSGAIRVRQIRAADVAELSKINRDAYPNLADDSWGESHLRHHLNVFPQGQLVATMSGKIVGGCSSLIVDLGREPLRFHTWSGMTDSGYFSNHDPEGDTLYGADVYVHPDARGEGVGHALYEARRKLCRKLNLRRILAGGRLWNYHEHADRYTPQEYAARVVAGELTDLVLSFQLREGFVLRGVMPNYLHDPLSHNHASLIEWLNPDYEPKPAGARKVRIACVQHQMRRITDFDDFATQVRYFVDIAHDYEADFVLFPEFITVQLLSHLDAMTSHEGILALTRFTSRFRKLMESLAREFGLTIIAGSTPVKKGKRLENVSYVCLPDGRSVEQPKLHITPAERRWWNISGGDQLVVVDTPKAKIGVQICYDIEFPEATRQLADEGAEIIFVPFCTDNRQGFMRVRYCAHARAIENQVYVAMAGNVGNLPDVENMDINYGQAAVLTPSDFAFARDGIAAETEINEETILMCDVDLDSLHGARSSGSVTPRLDRRTDLFQLITKLPRPKPNTSDDDGPLGDQPIRHG